jgi:flagellar biosynthesis GTPase FlhF
MKPDPLARLLEQIRLRHEQLPPMEEEELVTPSATPMPTSGAMLGRDKAGPEAAPSQFAAAMREALVGYGLLPGFARHVAWEAERLRGSNLARSREEEMAAVATVLTYSWKKPPRRPTPTRWHAFVGAPGVGKTTCLCKWLAQVALLADCPARAWRVDGPTANTAESLSVYGEVLGVPVERAWPDTPESSAGEVQFLDVPGANWKDLGALGELRKRLHPIPDLQIHLVLNAAYEVPLLREQIEAFSRLPITDLIFTHVDEETRWGKLWNFVLGTEFAIGFLSAGQNVPGDFWAASPEQLLPRHLQRQN